MRFRILFLSGCPDDARVLSQMLQPLPVDLDHTVSLRRARTMLRKKTYQAILTATELADATWLDVVLAAESGSGRLPVIVTDPQADSRLWAEVLNRGGYDLLTQPFYGPEVRRILANAVDRPIAMTAV